MAIAIDAVNASTDQTASPTTWNHTCGGVNNFLVVAIFATSASPVPATTAVTYGGISMTKVRADTATISTQLTEISIWFLHNPLAGSNQVSATITASGATPHFAGISSSYTGAQQSEVLDASNTATGAATGSQSFNVTTVKDKCWVFVAGINFATLTPTMAANQTTRGTVTLGSSIAAVVRTEDNAASVSPPAATSVGMTPGATAAEQGWLMTGVSIAPANTGYVINNFQFANSPDGNAGVLTMTEKIR